MHVATKTSDPMKPINNYNHNQKGSLSPALSTIQHPSGPLDGSLSISKDNVNTNNQQQSLKQSKTRNNLQSHVVSTNPKN